MKLSRAALSVGLVAALLGCAPAPTSRVATTGRVIDESVTVEVPRLATPRVNLNAGFATSGDSPAKLSRAAVQVGLGTTVRVASVAVVEGQRVTAGDLLVRLDDGQLTAAVDAARADAGVANAQVGVLDQAIDETRDKESDVKDARSTVLAGIAKATRARTQLSGKLGEARRQATKLASKRAQVLAALRTLQHKRAAAVAALSALEAKFVAVGSGLAQARAALAALPDNAPLEPRAALERTIEELTAARDGLQQGIRTLRGATGKLRAGIAAVTAARAQLDAGIAQLARAIPALTGALRTIDRRLGDGRAALRRLDRAAKAIRDVRAELERVRRLARVQADASRIAVQRASLDRAASRVTAPHDGVVTRLAAVGDQLSPGATLVELRPVAASVETWVTAQQLARLCPGTVAAVLQDGRPTPVRGRLGRVLPMAGFPPTFFSTDEIHLTRTIRVTVDLDEPLPAGLPVGVNFQPCAQEAPR